MTNETITQISLEELKKLNAENKYVPTPATAQEYEFDDDFWKNAQMIFPSDEGKERVALRIDREVLAFFRAGGKGYQTRMNAALRAVMEHLIKKNAR